MPPSVTTPGTENAALVQGPPVEPIVTPFDPALACVKGKISKDISFAVGAIADNTGKEQYADGGSGKFISQGTGDMVQSALFSAGLTVVNRRDPNIPLAESNWGLRALAGQVPSDFYITGSVTSLDFIPGGGGRVEIAGVGPRYRQSRILIGLDLAMTSAHSGKIVANAAVQKQLYAEELGFSTNRFLGETLLAVDVGAIEREAVHLALRQTLAYATFSLLAQVMPSDAVQTCAGQIVTNGLTSGAAELVNIAGDGSALKEARSAAAQAKSAAAAPPQGAPQGQAAGQPAGVRTAPASGAAAPVKMPPEAQRLANSATSYAARAIAAADSVLQAKSKEDATAAANESAQYMTLAIQALQEAAAAGLAGPEGDAAATLVENAIRAAEAAQKYVASGEFEKALPVPQPVPQQTPSDSGPNPASPTDKKLGGTN